MKKEELEKLYKNYKKMSTDDIQKHLETIKIVKLEHQGIGTIYGYYPIADKDLKKVAKDPRGFSYTFDSKTGNEPILDLKEMKQIPFLVKSSSRFFLKPDIGEVFDQIPEEDLTSGKITAVCINMGSQETLDSADGSEFLMVATLFTNEN